jgi:hypothetical protein
MTAEPCTFCGSFDECDDCRAQRRGEISRREAWRVYEREQLRSKIIAVTHNADALPAGWDEHLMADDYVAPLGDHWPPSPAEQEQARERAIMEEICRDIHERRPTHGHGGKWSTKGVPHKGWECYSRSRQGPMANVRDV